MIELKTERDYRDAHRKLWQWLAYRPDTDKRDWPGWEQYGRIDNHCFACHFANIGSTREYNCNECPCHWSNEKCYYTGSEYDDWSEAWEDGQQSTRLALKIRDCWRDIEEDGE